jgi:hypothetical protein
MNLPQLSDSQQESMQESMIEMFKALAQNRISHDDETKKYVLKRRDFEE